MSMSRMRTHLRLLLQSNAARYWKNHSGEIAEAVLSIQQMAYFTVFYVVMVLSLAESKGQQLACQTASYM